MTVDERQEVRKAFWSELNRWVFDHTTGGYSPGGAPLDSDQERFAAERLKLAAAALEEALIELDREGVRS